MGARVSRERRKCTPRRRFRQTIWHWPHKTRDIVSGQPRPSAQWAASVPGGCGSEGKSAGASTAPDWESETGEPRCCSVLFFLWSCMNHWSPSEPRLPCTVMSLPPEITRVPWFFPFNNTCAVVLVQYLWWTFLMRFYLGLTGEMIVWLSCSWCRYPGLPSCLAPV